ncbi:hypothetical protein CDL12_00679 [Handroanthus impetiginosus]|uniref:Uncharacterized protein n=1 Tax=Handroanthus impetiginosus TaxID=429701 RepID=A0A2G9I9Z3_9LAMI|nr:hypothetical protein CDL12_00679 [Handroanthus impetiginosus]
MWRIDSVWKSIVGGISSFYDGFLGWEFSEKIYRKFSAIGGGSWKIFCPGQNFEHYPSVFCFKISLSRDGETNFLR